MLLQEDSPSSFEDARGLRLHRFRTSPSLRPRRRRLSVASEIAVASDILTWREDPRINPARDLNFYYEVVLKKNGVC